MWFSRILAGITCLLAASCALPARPAAPALKPGSGLRIYLQPLPQETSRLTFTLAKVAVLRRDGTEVALRQTPVALGGGQKNPGQVRLVAADLPAGEYRGLLLTLEDATLRTEEGDTRLLVAESPLLVRGEFTIKADRIRTLFLSLSPERLLEAGYRFAPRFDLWDPKPVLPALKGFTTNSGAGTLTVFEKKTPEVTGTIALGRQPSELALDQAGRWVYAALAGDDAIAVVDVANETVRARIDLRPGDEPREISLSPDGRTLVAANAGSHSLSVIDALSLYERDRVLLPSRPTSVFAGPAGDRVYVVQESSSALTVIDTRTPAVLASVRLPDSPLRGSVGADGRELYLITAFSPELLALDASSLAVTGRKYVGHGALSLAVDDKVGLIYVGLESGEVVVLDPGLDLPIDTLAASGPVSYLVIDREENSLFAVIEGRARVEKFDLVSRKFLGALAVDEGVYAVAVMGEE